MVQKFLHKTSPRVQLFLLGTFLLIWIGSALPVHAQNYGTGVCPGVAYTGDECDPPNQARAESSINDLIHSIIDIGSQIVGVIAVLVLIYGGFRYVTAGGDSGKISSAQQTIIYALVGLVVAALAQVLVRFVLSEAT
jgi:hypothetical protein